MALTVQTNIAAITALKHLNSNSEAMNKSLERLSSGFRINNAADDAAGFAISSKLSAQTQRLQAASLNASQAQAMVKMADAGINEIQNMVTRIQVLATQASSANNTAESNKLNAERIKLESAIDKIASSTNYNGVNLLDGTGGGGSAFTSTFTAGTVNTGVSGASITTASTTNLNATYNLISDASGNVTITDDGTGSGTAATAFVVQFQANATVTATLDDGSKIDVTFNAAPSGVATTTAGTSGTVAASGQAAYTADASTSVSTDVAEFSASVVSAVGVSENYVFNVTNTATNAGTVTVTLGGNTVGTAAITDATAAKTYSITTADGDVLSLNQAVGALTVEASKVLGNLTTGSNASATQVFQVGADTTAANQVGVNLSNSYTSAALGLGSGDLLTQSGARAYLNTATTAMDTLISNRADLGATTNQIAFIQANLATSIEQATASVSSIRDADMAQEMASFTKNQILTQASTAMLAQANQAAQNVLTLFR